MSDVIEPNANDFYSFASVPTQATAVDASTLDLGHLADTAGWKVLKKYIEGQIALLDDINVDVNATVEQIGFKYIASRVARVQLESIIAYVESSRAEA